MANLQETLEGFIRIISSIIPNNLNPKLWVARNYDIFGANQNFSNIDELVSFHPNKMKRGMRGTVQNYPSAGQSTDFKMMTEPQLLLDANGDSIITIDNFTNFWQTIETISPEVVRVYNYAPDGPNGAAPPYPYTQAYEYLWSAEYNPQKNHRWMRFRDDDVDDNGDGIYDNWTVPISLNAYSSGDYVENRFQRYALLKPDQDLTSVGQLDTDRYYIIITGMVTIDDVDFTEGRRFKYESGSTYVFDSGTVVQETNVPPPRTDEFGNPNNEPAGWYDTPPSGSDLLWMITAQKSVYGQLKSEWVIKRVEEKPNYVRYSYSAEPHPDTLCSTTEDASEGTPADIRLNDAGWTKTFIDQTFMAYREDNPNIPGEYTKWEIEKIAGESGEYVDRVFKLFPINIDPDAPELQPPTNRNPQNEGWSDAPVEETATDINYVSEAHKFFDGTLKTPWSKPVPYTGKSTYQDTIDASPGDDFKTDPNTGQTVPDSIVLTAKLYKGVEKLWEAGLNITFKWIRVYDNGAIDDTEASTDTNSDFYYMPSIGVPGSPGYLFDKQRVTIKPDAVTGKAVFRCEMQLETGGDPIDFEEEVSILDITDGLDARNLSITADNQLLIYDTSNSEFVPANIVLRAYYSNLGSPNLYWYYYNGSAWVSIATGQDTYSATADSYFTADGTAQEARFAVSTHPTDPMQADGETYFSDFITIGKTSAAGLGAPGENAVIALLDNETHTVVLDTTTTQPFSGEIGDGGKATTKVEMWDGGTKLSIGVVGAGNDVEMTISSDNPNITFASKYGNQGTDSEKYGEVYVDSWGAGERSAVCTIVLTYNTRQYIKQFSVGSTMDAPGAIILDIDCDTGLEWTPSQRGNKTVVGNLYDSNVLQTSGYQYRWLIDGNALSDSRGSWSEANRTMTLSRTDVGSTGDITCEVRKTGEATSLRSRTVKFTDVLDAKMYIAWTDALTVNNSNKIPDGTDPASLPVVVNGVTWVLSTDSYWETHTAEYQAIGEEVVSGNSSTWIWTYPQDFRGEKGDQGPNGDYFYNMFKVDGSNVPASDATILDMKNAEWSRIPATSGIIWMTTGRFNGTDDVLGGDGYPPDTSTPELGWSDPIKLTGSDGIGGDPGDTGWAMEPALVADGDDREVIQVADWIGGTGSKPGHIGEYVGSGGFVSDIAQAINVKGRAVQVQVGGNTWNLPGPFDGDIWIDRE